MRGRWGGRQFSVVRHASSLPSLIGREGWGGREAAQVVTTVQRVEQCGGQGRVEVGRCGGQISEKGRESRERK